MLISCVKFKGQGTYVQGEVYNMEMGDSRRNAFRYMMCVILNGLWVGHTSHQRCQVSYVVHEELNQWPWYRVGGGGGGGVCVEGGGGGRGSCGNRGICSNQQNLKARDVLGR